MIGVVAHQWRQPVSDNPGGIPAEIIGQIFAPYCTTKGPSADTRLGLFIKGKEPGREPQRRQYRPGAEFRIEV